MTDTTGSWDLTQLAAGTRQRVFVETAGSEGEWVYKLPVADPAETPYGPGLSLYRPGSAPLQTAYNLAVRWPDAARRRARRAPWRVARFCGMGLGAGCAVRDIVIATWFRITRERRFLHMLRLLDHISRHGMSHLLLPFRIVRRARATLRRGAEVEAYDGPIVMQRHATAFFHRSEGFDEFDWRDVIDTQHRLWQRGIGLVDAVDILGPRNWALHDGRLRLADTSSMTTDRDVALRALDPTALDARIARSLAGLRKAGIADAAANYFAFVRWEINQETLEHLWIVDRSRGGA